MNISNEFVNPKGFNWIGDHVGLKKKNNDMAIMISDKPAEYAGCFTQNIVKAAPVIWDMDILEKGNKVKGFTVISGNANACTGKDGINDNKQIAETTAELSACNPEEILVFSTGVIGVKLNMDIVTNGIKAIYPKLDSSIENSLTAARAIMTTDTFMKTVSSEININGKKVTISGMAKGSGMIHPNMATLLSFIVTDANITNKALNKALQNSVIDSYNMISVDGDTSTNDSVVVLANGMADNEIIDENSNDYETFAEALDAINKKLAKDIARDGEGATKLMEVKIMGAGSEEDARKLAKSVVSSNLFKATLFGSDANWGRILCAMGYSGGNFDTSDVTVTIKSNNNEKVLEEITLAEKSISANFSEEKATEILDRENIFIDIILNEGDYSATAWGCDLTYDYVKINGDYRS